MAASFLRGRGYRVLYRNYLVEGGEIDLICRDGKVLAFVEVRSRESAEFGRPSETIGAAKERTLRTAAERYLALLKRDDIHYRFDAVEVILAPGEIPVCTLIQNLFS